MPLMGVASLPWSRVATPSALHRSRGLVAANRPSIRRTSIRAQGSAGHSQSSLPISLSRHAGQQPTLLGQERQTATDAQPASSSPAAAAFLRPALRVACAGAFALCLGFLLPGAASAGEVAAGAAASSNPVAGKSWVLCAPMHLYSCITCGAVGFSPLTARMAPAPAHGCDACAARNVGVPSEAPYPLALLHPSPYRYWP